MKVKLNRDLMTNSAPKQVVYLHNALGAVRNSDITYYNSDIK